MGIQGFKTERIMKKWIQERLWFGDTDTTIWAGLDGVGDSGLEECQRSCRGYRVLHHIYQCHLVLVIIHPSAVRLSALSDPFSAFHHSSIFILQLF